MNQFIRSMINCYVNDFNQDNLKLVCEDASIVAPTMFIKVNQEYRFAWVPEFQGKIDDICDITCMMMGEQMLMNTSFGIFVPDPDEEGEYDYEEQTYDNQVYHDLPKGLEVLYQLLKQYY